MQGWELYFNFLHNIFQAQLASVRAKDLYNLMDFCIHTTFFAKESILLCITGKFSDSQNFLLPNVTGFFPIMHKPVCIFFYYRWSGLTYKEVGVTPVILSGTIFKAVVAVILTFEILMRKLA